MKTHATPFNHIRDDISVFITFGGDRFVKNRKYRRGNNQWVNRVRPIVKCPGTDDFFISFR